MTATVITAETLIHRYADDIAQQPPATYLAALISQLDTAAPRYEVARINGHDDLQTASSYLDETQRATGTDRDAFLRRAHDLLRLLVSDRTQEHRTDAGD
ncbi:hypothetical protein [Streptomyces sp. NPDC048266]|uniref:hypothetical protein n=1 Tax=Streptomyces sp. NPDC048266 TaxID=3155787 RepID=UPI0033ED1EDF